MQNAEYRGRVPRDTAELMLGTTDPAEVVSRIGELAVLSETARLAK